MTARVNPNARPCARRWRGGAPREGESEGQPGTGASEVPIGPRGGVCAPPSVPSDPLRRPGHRALDDLRRSVSGIEQGFRREVSIALGHRRIAVAEHLLNDVETHPRLGHVTYRRMPQIVQPESRQSRLGPQSLPGLVYGRVWQSLMSKAAASTT
jgi:hypothetical protein